MKYNLRLTLEKIKPDFDINNNILFVSVDDDFVYGYKLSNFQCVYEDKFGEGFLINAMDEYLIYNYQGNHNSRVLDVETLKLIETNLPNERVIYADMNLYYTPAYFFVACKSDNKLLKVKKSDFSVVNTYENITPTVYGKYIFVDDNRYVFLSKEDITCFSFEGHKQLWSRKLINIVGKSKFKVLEHIYAYKGKIYFDIWLNEGDANLYVIDINNGKTLHVEIGFACGNPFFSNNNELWTVSYTKLNIFEMNTLKNTVYDFSDMLGYGKIHMYEAIAIANNGVLYFANGAWSKHIYSLDINTRELKLIIKLPTQKNFGTMDIRFAENRLFIRGSNRSLYVYEMKD